MTEFTVNEPTPRLSQLDEIVKKIQDPSTPVADITKMIALEMASVLHEMSKEGDLTFSTNLLNRHKSLNDQLKGLGVLQKSLSDADIQSRKDVLNIDGPKFKFVFSTLVDFQKQAMKEAGIDDPTAANVLRHYEDICRSGEEKLRRDLIKK